MPYDWRGALLRPKQAVSQAGLVIEQPFCLILESRTSQQARDLEARLPFSFEGARAFSLFSEPHQEALSVFTRLEFDGVEEELVRPIAYDVAYGLCEEFDLVSAEPDVPTPYFVEPGSSPSDEDLESAIVKAFCEVSGTPPSNKRWAIEMIKVPEALAFSEHTRPDQTGGNRVLVAQPDTGIVLPNLDLEDGAIVPSRGWDVLRKTQGAIDPLVNKGNPGHGTATGSVVISRPQGEIMGAAPKAVLYPIRCINSVMVFKPDPVARAINKAIEINADIITMSLGGVPCRAVKAAIRVAVTQGIIVLAAAGNCVSLVVWPARYDEVIGVAGCNIRGEAWIGSCRGKTVDITAPAEQVWHASATKPDGFDHGQGTSFAVALVAGAAAQWLAYHGRQSLTQIAREHNLTIQTLFKLCLAETASPAPLLSRREFGPGIVNCEQLLKKDPRQIAMRAALPVAEQDDPTPSDFSELLGAFHEGDAEAAQIDWHRYSAEIGHIALKRALSATSEKKALSESAPPPISSSIRQAAQVAQNRSLLRLLGEE